jgi:hypothetical protein
MLRNALEELGNVERKYGHLRELQPVFAAARRVRVKRGAPEVAA